MAYVAAGRFRGRPPFAPFVREARALAGLVMLPSALAEVRRQADGPSNTAIKYGQ
jgi:hypothetical protein